MSAGDSDKMKPRKRFLNVVYFIDSSRTRTMKLPLPRVQLFVFCALTMVAWSVGSLFIIGALVKDRTDLISSLRQSMNTVFEFESVHDGVYETAYPTGKIQPKQTQPVMTTAATTPSTNVVTGTGKALQDNAKPSSASLPGKAAPEEMAKVAPTSQKDVQKDRSVDVVVSNPVVKTSTSALNLTFDLTNKDPNARSEGYLWATAEFKSDSGETHILKAPSEIAVNGKGEIEDHKRATFFAIRRFKRNEFQFQLIKDHPGTVIGVKIGISDKPGEHRRIYDVPLGIKVGYSGKESDGASGKKGG